MVVMVIGKIIFLIGIVVFAVSMAMAYIDQNVNRLAVTGAVPILLLLLSLVLIIAGALLMDKVKFGRKEPQPSL
jgi:hypothetical protein